MVGDGHDELLGGGRCDRQFEADALGREGDGETVGNRGGNSPVSFARLTDASQTWSAMGMFVCLRTGQRSLSAVSGRRPSA
ncbi:hypothetical protein GCM10009603_30140 [Nocardiopsis exhalans]